MNAVRAIQDRRDGKRYGVAIATWLAFFVVALVTGQSWLWSFIGAGVLATYARGVACIVPAGDPTLSWKVWGRPMWLRYAAAAAYVVMLFLALSDDGHHNAMTWLLFGIPAVAIGLHAAQGAGYIGQRGDSNGGGGRSFREPSVTASPTPEDVAEGRMHKSMLGLAGLVWRSPATGDVLYPNVLGHGRDRRGLVYFLAEVIPGRQTIADWEKGADKLASAWGVPRVTVTEERPHVARVTAITRESGLSGPVVWHPVADLDAIAATPVAQYVSSLPMGGYVASGDPWTMSLWERNFITAGIPGSGKSSTTNALLAHLAMHPDVRLAFLDLKNGVEAMPWRDRLDVTIDNRDGDAGTERALRFISEAVADMRGRYARMMDAGITNAWNETGPDGLPFLGASEPVKVLVVDECSELFKTSTPDRSKLASRCIEELRTFIQQGRAAGYVLIMSTQYARDDALPTPIRENASDAIAFRMKSDKGTAAVLGWDYVPRDDMTNPAKITAQGQAVVLGADAPDGERVQMAWLSKEAKAEVVAMTAHYRRDWLDAKAEAAPFETENAPEPGETGATAVVSEPVAPSVVETENAREDAGEEVQESSDASSTPGATVHLTKHEPDNVWRV